MNNVRRKGIGKMLSELVELAVVLEEAYELGLQFCGEEEEYRENMPENLQDGDEYLIIEEESEHLKVDWLNYLVLLMKLLVLWKRQWYRRTRL